MAKALRTIGGQHARILAATKEEATVSDVFSKLASKDLARDPAVESAYILAFAKFVELFKTLASSQQTMVRYSTIRNCVAYVIDSCVCVCVCV